MALIYEAKNFLVETADKPLLGRSDGGHLVINPKIRVNDLQQFNAPTAIELMRLIMVVGEAMSTVLNKNGVDIGRINYQDNGNWGVFKPEGPYQHFHLYGRAKSAVQQKYGQACYFPHQEDNPEFYENLEPLNHQDITDLNLEITRLLTTDKYANSAWKLTDNNELG